MGQLVLAVVGLVQVLRPFRRFILTLLLESLAFLKGVVHGVCLMLSGRIHLEGMSRVKR